jgi:hypothetical protein
MREVISIGFSGVFKLLRAGTALFLLAALPSLPLAAQSPEPIKPPPAQPGSASSAAPAQSLPPSTAAPAQSSVPAKEEPPVPAEQIIQRFAAREAEFKKERENYTYTQTFIVQTIDENGRVDGEYRLTSDIVFTPAGKRYEKVTYAPAPTLERISLSPQDMEDLERVQPFVLTTEELPKYDIHYIGRESVDEVGTYAFEVAPKRIEKNQRYFQGRIWVDDKDLEIVKTYGKAVPDIKKGGNENYFPRFETYRENIEGNYWFPTFTRADDVLRFTGGSVHIRMTVRYTNYQRFTSTIKLGTATEVKPNNR